MTAQRCAAALVAAHCIEDRTLRTLLLQKCGEEASTWCEKVGFMAFVIVMTLEFSS
jgi:hypothetical protein